MNGLYEEFRLALHAIWMRRWLALGVAWGICLLGWLVLSLVPNKYESKASIFVQTQTLLPDKLGITPAERKNDVDAITQTLMSAENLEKVARAAGIVGPGASPDQAGDAAAGLRKKIKVVSKLDNLFEITAESNTGGLSNAENARRARDTVQKLLDLFVEGNLSGDRTETAQTLQFLDAQLAQRQAQLEQAEQKRAAFEAQHVGSLPGVGSASQRAEAARVELGQIDSNLMAAQGALAAINGQMGSTSSAMGGASVVGDLQAQIAQGAARGWTNDHPDMQALRRQLEAARAAERAGVRTVGTPNPMYVTLRSMQAEKQAAVAALSARKAQLQSEMAQYQARQIAEPELAAEQARLTRDYDVLKTAYDKLLADREEVKLRGSLQSDTDAIQFRVIEPPSAPSVPIAPNRPLLLFVILIFGLGAGAGVTFGMSQLKPSYATAARLERASGLQVIGSISEVLSPASRLERRKKLRLFAGGAMGLAGLFIVLLAVELIQRMVA